MLLVMLLFGAFRVGAANTELPSGFVIGDSDGIRASKDGGYMIYVTGMMPGDTLHKEVTISNLEENDLPYTITMSAEPLDQTGPLRLLEKLDVTLTLDGKVLYQGPADGHGNINMVEDALDLGVYKSGDTRTMQVDIKLDSNISAAELQDKSVAEVKWIFVAVKSTAPEPPYTGELVKYTLYGVIGGMLLMLIVLLLIKKRREQEPEAIAVDAQGGPQGQQVI